MQHELTPEGAEPAAPPPEPRAPWREPTAEPALVKGDLLYSAEGLQVFATGVLETAIMEWEDPAACQLALVLQNLVRRHALSTNYLDRFDHRSLAVRRIEPLALTVVVEATGHEVELRWQGTGGEPLDEETVRQLPEINYGRVEVMQDTAVHAARSLRAHLALLGYQRLRLTLRFGIGPGGDCVLEVINPVACDFGSSDFQKLSEQLGGTPA